MKKSLKKAILIIMKNKERHTYSIPDDKDHLQVYDAITNSGEINRNDVEQLIYFPATLYDLEDIQYHYDAENRTFDEKDLAIDYAIDEFRKRRTAILKSLDIEFMKSLENMDCEACRGKIIKIKKHMRKMPSFLEQYLKNFSIEEITSFNCFNNVYDIGIINGGSGYEESPAVNIESPNGKSAGIQLEAKAVVNEGKVTDIIITQIGSGYASSPKVNIDKPSNGNIALAVASPPENDMFK